MEKDGQEDEGERFMVFWDLREEKEKEGGQLGAHPLRRALAFSFGILT